MTDDPVAFFVALLEDVGDFVLALLFILDVHYRVVNVGIELLSGCSEGLDAELIEHFGRRFEDERESVCDLLGFGVLRRPFEIVDDRKNFFERVGISVGVKTVAFLCRTLSEVVVLGADS